ncbi:hypothetical protein ACXJY6_07870 [Vibrio sp. RC27]
MKYITLLFSLFSFSLFAGDKHINEPYLKDIYLIGNTAIKLRFSERMSGEALLNFESYVLTGSQQTGVDHYTSRTLTISSIESVLGESEKTVILVTFIEPLEYFETIVVTVVGVKSRTGIMINLDRNSLSDNSFTPPLLI